MFLKRFTTRLYHLILGRLMPLFHHILPRLSNHKKIFKGMITWFFAGGGDNLFFLDSFFHVQTSCESSFVDALPIQGSTDRKSWSARIPWIPAPIPEMWLGTPYPWCGHKVALFCSSAPPTHHHSALYVVHYWKILRYATVNHIICVVSTIWLYIATSPMSICLNGAHNDHW